MAAVAVDDGNAFEVADDVVASEGDGADASAAQALADPVMVGGVAVEREVVVPGE